MPAPLQKIAFIIEQFAMHAPGQQLLDRFLLGYPHGGEFRRWHGCALALHVMENPDGGELERRSKDFGLRREMSLTRCVSDADAIVVVPRASVLDGDLMCSAIEAAPAGARWFIYGAVAETRSGAERIARAAAARDSVVLAGTTTATAWRLPEVALPRGAALRRALVVVQGPYVTAEVEALNALLSLAAPAGQFIVKSVEFGAGDDVWAALGAGFEPLLASALSRSDSPQGDALVDSRTQDLVGLGLVRKLAKSPRCWLLRHASGLTSLLAVLDGVVADFNMAVETGSGTIWSWQIYRPPAPFDHTYSRLVGFIEAFFRTGQPPWHPERALVMAQVLEAISGQYARR